MSSHALAPQDPRHEVTIGWDPPLANFFLQVCDLEVDDAIADPVIVWLGADGYATGPDVDAILEEAGRWAIVPDELRGLLLEDCEREGTRPKSRFLAMLSSQKEIR